MAFKTSSSSAPTMTGTSGASFNVVSVLSGGAVGYRQIEGGAYRVRVEPFNGNYFSFPEGWKTPGDGQNRFSTVVKDQASLLSAISVASAIISGGDPTAPKPLFKASFTDHTGVVINVGESVDGELTIGDNVLDESLSFDRNDVEQLSNILNAYLAS